MDTMVTRREHDADVRRLDAEAERTREALLCHERDESQRLTEIEASVRAGDAEILASMDSRLADLLAVVERDKAERAAQAHRDAEQRHADRRRLLGMVVSAGALGQLLTRWL